MTVWAAGFPCEKFHKVACRSSLGAVIPSGMILGVSLKSNESPSLDGWRLGGSWIWERGESLKGLVALRWTAGLVKFGAAFVEGPSAL